jgi:beta-lactam-binding protein with PASTA domain
LSYVLKFITHRPLWVNILVGLLVGIGIFSVFVLSLNWLTHHNESRTVPAVTGRSFDEAKAILKKAGFDVEIQDSIFTDTAKASAVLKQFPDADEIVKVNRTVYLTINRAVPPEVEMPNLNGYSYRSAEMLLINAGLKVGDTSYKTDLSNNSVLEQRYNGSVIAPGTKLRMGSSISLVLSNGLGSVEYPVPPLTGFTVAQALSIMQELGIAKGVLVSIDGQPITDTMNAYVGRQIPEPFNDERKRMRIRSGQTMDLFLQMERPVRDSVGSNLPLPE